MNKYKVLCERDKNDSLVYAISLVDEPANQQMFIYMSKLKAKLSVSNEKRLITGVVLIPNQEIPRYDEKLGNFILTFGEKEIRELSKDFFINGFHQNSNVNHDDNCKINGLTFVESWIVEDPLNDKSNALGFKDLPKGTWMATAYVEDDMVWEQVKRGELKGFSIESILETRKINDIVKTNFKKQESMKLIKQLFSIFETFKNIETVEGFNLVVESLNEGSKVSHLNDENELVTFNGSFTFEDKVYDVKEGVITSISDKPNPDSLEGDVEIDLNEDDPAVEAVEDAIADDIAKDVIEEVAENPALDVDSIVEKVVEKLEPLMFSKMEALFKAKDEQIETKLSIFKDKPLVTKLGAQTPSNNNETYLERLERISKQKQ